MERPERGTCGTDTTRLRIAGHILASNFGQFSLKFRGYESVPIRLVQVQKKGAFSTEYWCGAPSVSQTADLARHCPGAEMLRRLHRLWSGVRGRLAELRLVRPLFSTWRRAGNESTELSGMVKKRAGTGPALVGLEGC